MRGAATRGAVMDAELARSQGDVSAKALAGLYAGGYQSALDASQRAAQTQAGIGQIYGQVMAPGAQQGLMGDVGQLLILGKLKDKFWCTKSCRIPNSILWTWTICKCTWANAYTSTIPKS